MISYMIGILAFVLAFTLSIYLAWIESKSEKQRLIEYARFLKEKEMQKTRSRGKEYVFVSEDQIVEQDENQDEQQDEEDWNEVGAENEEEMEEMLGW